MQMDKIIQFIKDELFDYTKRVVVDTDNISEKPLYPFYSIKAVTIIEDAGEAGNYSADFVDSIDGRFKYDYLERLETQPNMVISVNAYGKDSFIARTAAMEAFGFFKFAAREILAKENYIIVDVLNVEDRTVLNVDNYEYRYGFDVRVRYVYGIERRAETIETYKIIKGENK